MSFARAKIDEHGYRCPICHEVADSRDLDTVALYLEPGCLRRQNAMGEREGCDISPMPRK